MQTITGLQDLNVNVGRTLSRLKSVFVSFGKNLWLSGVADGGQPVGCAVDRFHLYGSKEWNDFFSPGSRNRRENERIRSMEDEFQFQVQIGSKLFCEYPIQSHSEAYSQLRQTLGIRSNDLHNFDIKDQYHINRFVLGVDTEKIIDAGFSGLNTKGGSLMSVRFKYNSVDNTRWADRIYITLHADLILDIYATGARLLD